MMEPAHQRKLREFLRQCLADAGHPAADDDPPGPQSLFISGRLDSLAMTRLVLFLEEAFGLDFGAVQFEVERIDSLDAITALVGAQARRVGLP